MRNLEKNKMKNVKEFVNVYSYLFTSLKKTIHLYLDIC